MGALVRSGLTHFRPALHFKQKPVIRFILQNKRLVSIEVQYWDEMG